MTLLLTAAQRVSIIKPSSLAPLFGPSLRRALNFSGGLHEEGRMPGKLRAVFLSGDSATFADFVYTASRQGECYGK